MDDYSVVSTVYERLMLAISFEHVCCFSWLPQKVTFDAGPQLQFLFHSDNTNNEWGYKFTVTAMGLPDITISWISDLQLLMARLMGRLASRTLALKSPHGETALQNLDQTKVYDQIGVIMCVCVGGYCSNAQISQSFGNFIWIWEDKWSHWSIFLPFGIKAINQGLSAGPGETCSFIFIRLDFFTCLPKKSADNCSWFRSLSLY